MSPAWELGRTGQLYAKDESSYGTAPTFAATDAFRHLNVNLHSDPKSLTPSPERHTDPSQRVLFTRRAKGNFTVKGMLYPSGTLNTLPEANAFLKNAIGAAAQNITLATTFSGTPTTTTGTIASATGLVAGQAVQINIAGVGTFIRWLTTAGTSAVWAPALPSAPVAGDTLKGGVTYTPSTALAASMDIAHYPQAPAASAPKRELLGCVMDKMVLSFDSNLEPMVEFSGPAKGFASSVQSQAGGFTTVGSESGIPSGLTGYFNFAGTLYQVEKVELTLANAMELQNTALGTSAAVAYFRKNKRVVSIRVNAKVSDDTTMWAQSLTQASNDLHLQIGTTAGYIIGLYAPAVTIMNPPDQPDSDETNNWDFNLTALSPSSANSEFYLGLV